MYDFNPIKAAIPGSKLEIIDKVTPYTTEEDRGKYREIQKKQSALISKYSNLEAIDITAAKEFYTIFQEGARVILATADRYIKDRGKRGLLADAKAIINAISKEDFLACIANAEDKDNRAETFENCYCYIRYCLWAQIRGLGEEKIRPYIEKRVISFGYEKPEGLEIPQPEGVIEGLTGTAGKAAPEEITAIRETQESKIFYNTPTSPVSDLLLTVLGAGETVGALPYRKALINNSTKIEVIENKKQREIRLKNTKADIRLVLDDIDRLVGNNKGAKKLFVLALTKINERGAVRDKKLPAIYVSFPLKELVDIGFYGSINSAYNGFNAGMFKLTSIKIAGETRRGKKIIDRSNRLAVPFIGSDIRGGTMLYLSKRACKLEYPYSIFYTAAALLLQTFQQGKRSTFLYLLHSPPKDAEDREAGLFYNQF